MFRYEYDSDVSVWSPQGRLYQVEYAMESVQYGTVVVGIKSKLFAVIACVKKVTSDMASYQKKMVEIDNHIGIAVSGLIPDAKILSQFMRTECLANKFSEQAPIPVERLVSRVVKKMHLVTQRYNRRPYGIGMIVAGYDDLGPHIYEISPSVNYFSCKAMAIGQRYQTARTYLEKNVNEFLNASCEDIVKHCLRALQSTLRNTEVLNSRSVTVGIVGNNCNFKILTDNEVSEYLQLIEEQEGECSKTQDQSANIEDTQTSDQ